MKNIILLLFTMFSTLAHSQQVYPLNTVGIEVPNGSYFSYKDRILGERKVINSDGSIIIDRISNFNNQYPEFRGINLKYSNPSQKQIYFVTGICGKTANLDVTFLDAAKTQMSLHLIYNPGYLREDCPYYNSVVQGNDLPINFPKDTVITKQ